MKNSNATHAEPAATISEEAAAKLRTHRGLRKKFFTRVVLPPLIPFLILGLIGYFNLTGLVKSALVDQLKRAADTTAAKIEREFSIRRTVLRRTGEEIFQIKKDFEDPESGKKAVLSRNRTTCSSLIDGAPVFADPVSGQSGVDISPLIDRAECAPFLAEFAKVTRGNQPPTKARLKSAVDDGFNKQNTVLDEEERRLISDRFSAVVDFFPETTEIVLVDRAEEPKVVERLTDAKTSLLTESNQPYTKESRTQDIVTPGISHKDFFLVIVGYQVEAADRMGSILAVYNVHHDQFLQPTLEGAPTPHKQTAQDVVYLADAGGAVALPKHIEKLSVTDDLQRIASGTKTDPTLSFKQQKTELIARATRVPDLPWAVAVAAPASLVLAPLRQAQFIAGGALGLSLGMALVLGLIFVAAATRAVKSLLSGALTFAQGNLEHTIILKTKDELQTLAETMNEMARKIKAAEQALVEKNNEFIYIATHELKAPLTAIIGYLSLIVDEGIGSVDRKGRELITTAYGQVFRLRELINDLLDIARVEAGRTEFSRESVPVAGVIAEVIETLAPLAQEKGIAVTTTPKTTTLRVMTDQDKLRVVLTNFVSNAIKYNRPKGTITIAVAEEAGQVTIGVRDTGYGIPKRDLEKLFTKFFRVQKKEFESVPGTGLGLFIVKRFVEKMGGSVFVDSVEGKGSTFGVILPKTSSG